MDLAERARRKLIRETRLLRSAQRRVKLARHTVTKRKVDFVVAGTMKGGTTVLDEYLRAHPEVCMAHEKEVHFFNFDQHFPNDVPDYDWYHSFFSPSSRHKVIGEATPGYMYFPKAPGRIQAYNPAMKLVIVLRNPVDRAYSQWNMNHVSNKSEPISFRDALDAESGRLSNGSFVENRRFSYVARGLYARQLRYVWQFFPREQTFIFKNEDLRSHPQETLDQVFGFLGVSSIPHVKPREALVGSYEQPLSTEDRRHTAPLFEADIRELEQLLGWDCSGWLP